MYDFYEKKKKDSLVAWEQKLGARGHLVLLEHKCIISINWKEPKSLARKEMKLSVPSIRVYMSNFSQ